MIYNYISPIGIIQLSERDGYLLKANFADEADGAESTEKSPVLSKSIEWLDLYFKGIAPGFTPELNPQGSDFSRVIWGLLLKIPYGKVTSYGEIAREVEKIMQKDKMSAQAVGGGARRNPIAIFIPCHRVVGANGELTGYAGGIEKKEALLKYEGIAELKGIMQTNRAFHFHSSTTIRQGFREQSAYPQNGDLS